MTQWKIMPPFSGSQGTDRLGFDIFMAVNTNIAVFGFMMIPCSLVGRFGV
jgi:hypothetical protein